MSPRILPALLFTLASALQAQVRPHKQITPAVRPPAAALPVAQTRQSTALAAAARMNAAPVRQLPGFALVSSDGKIAEASSLAHSGRWLLIFRPAVCAPCDKLLTALGDSGELAEVAAAVTVIVAGASPDVLATTRAQFPQWSAAIWLADPQGAGKAALKAKGFPMVYGMEDSAIAFTVAGVPGDSAQVRRTFGPWLRQPASSAAHMAKANTAPAATGAKQ